MTGALDFDANMRAAFRQRLLATPLPDVTLTGTLAANGYEASTTQVGLDFAALGFRVGDYALFPYSLKANGSLNRLTAVAAKKLTVATALAAESKAGRVYVPLPDIAYQGEHFEPDPMKPYIAESVSVPSSVPSPMGGVVRHTVLATATLFYPAGQGTIGLESMTGRLRQRFAPGTVLSYGGDAGKVFGCEASQLLDEPEWISRSVTASVMAWTLN